MPTGYYGKLQFAYISQYVSAALRNTYYWNGPGANLFVRLASASYNFDQTISVKMPSVVNASSDYAEHKTVQYGNSGIFKDLYMEQGSKLFIDCVFDNTKVEYEAVIHLYKLP